jgi:thioredoxin 1
MMHPVIDELAAEYDGRVIIGKLNVDENSDTCEKFGVMNIPTVLFFKNGELVNRSVGYTPKPRIQPLVEGLL